MRALRSTLGAAVLAVTLAACAPGGQPAEEVPPEDPVTSAPAPGGTDPEPQDPAENPAPSVSLPQLPVGGSGEFVDESQDLQCAEVSWIVDEGGPGALRDGIRIDITGARVDARYFELSASGCQDRGESCAGYTFTSSSDSPACVLPVRTRRPLTVEVEDTSLTLAGTIRCLDVDPAECSAFVAAAKAGSGSVQLSPPAPAEDPSGENGGSASPIEEPSDHPDADDVDPSESSSAPEPSDTAGG